MTPQPSPKLFISYSWSTPDREQWVLDLAEALTESGVHVLLDKWDLREGNDSLAFMESMVTDPSVSKVILICDKVYASKADGRAGGVGTEAQIISANVYAKKDQSKFVAVLAERDQEGNPYLPVYYTSKMYIDLSESDRYADNFEKLIRWIFDKPLHKRPQLGSPPNFILNESAAVMGTTVAAKRAIDGFKTDKGYKLGALDEYLTLFSQQMERFRICDRDGEFDDLVIKSIEEFTPARNEFTQVIRSVVQYSQTEGYSARLHRFFESILPYTTRPPGGVNNYRETDFDNFKFLVHELFLVYLAVLLQSEHFDAATVMLSQPFYCPSHAEYGRGSTVGFDAFCENVKTFQVRNKRLKLRRLSLRADSLKQRFDTSDVLFRHIMQADFVCFLRAELVNDRHYGNWFPETLIYATNQYGPFEIFARASSKDYLPRLLPLLGIADVAPLTDLMMRYREDRQRLPRWQFESINPSTLLGLEELGVR